MSEMETARDLELDDLRDSICREMFECDYIRLSDPTKRMTVDRRFEQVSGNHYMRKVSELFDTEVTPPKLNESTCDCKGEMHDEDCPCTCTDYRKDPLCLKHSKPIESPQDIEKGHDPLCHWHEGCDCICEPKPAPQTEEPSIGQLSYDGQRYIFLQNENGPTMFAEIRGNGAGLPLDANAQRVCDLWNAAKGTK